LLYNKRRTIVSSHSDDPFAVLETAAQRQTHEQHAQRALSAARVKLILGRDAKSAFFATLVLRLQPYVDWQIETIATDGKSLHYCPTFVTGLSPDELVGVLAHEAMHCALAHPFRRGSRDPEQWNIACDLAINPLLVQAGIVLPRNRLMPGEGTHASFEPFKSADEYYCLLSQPPLSSPTNEQESSAGADPGGCGQVIDPKQDDPASQQQHEADWKVALVQAQQAAHGRGELPQGLGRTVQQIVHPPADWRCLLRAFVAQQAKNDYSWLRPNRRLLVQGLYLPGVHSEELGEVVLAVDTSGSISEELLNRFAVEVNAVLEAYDCTLTVLYHDTDIQAIQTWTSVDGPLQLTPVGGGGTNHGCVFEWLEQSAVTPACVICLTDLETTFPDTTPPYPVLWAVTGSSDQAPFGMVVPLST
jgi:predicted metal-dependent peptidase